MIMMMAIQDSDEGLISIVLYRVIRDEAGWVVGHVLIVPRWTQGYVRADIFVYYGLCGFLMRKHC